jgi:hypothetical protein
VLVASPFDEMTPRLFEVAVEERADRELAAPTFRERRHRRQGFGGMVDAVTLDERTQWPGGEHARCPRLGRIGLGQSRYGCQCPEVMRFGVESGGQLVGQEIDPLLELESSEVGPNRRHERGGVEPVVDLGHPVRKPLRRLNGDMIFER